MSLAIAIKEGQLTIEQVRKILGDAFKELNFDNLADVLFVGDGTYLQFEDKFVEIRPSGTDAKTKAYAGGSDKNMLVKYADTLGNYSGELNDVYKKYLNSDYIEASKEKSFEIYNKYTLKDEDKREFNIPKYNFLKGAN